MYKFALALALVACVFAQDDDAAPNCQMPAAFISTTINAIQFRRGTTYTNVTERVTYTKNSDDDGWAYNDFNAGRSYRAFSKKRCMFNEVDEGVISPEEAAAGSTHLFDIEDLGLSAATYQQEHLTFEVLLDRNCVPVLTKATYDGRVRMINFNFDVQLENLNLDPIKDIQPTLETCAQVID